MTVASPTGGTALRTTRGAPPPRCRPCLTQRAGVALLAVVLSVACGPADSPAPPPEIADAGPFTDTLAPQLVPLPPPPAWRMEEAGPLLAVVGVTQRTAQLVLPEYADSTIAELPARDVAELVPLRVELFARGGRVGEGLLVEAQARASDGCYAWPRAEVRSPANGIVEPWTVALETGRAVAMPLDSIEALTPPDSARLAVEVARLASRAPGDTATAFYGLPYVVRMARRFTLDDETDVLVARAERRVATEAMPLAENLFLVAERERGEPRASWQLAYVERPIGTEVSVETTDVLAALRIGARRRPTLVVARDHGEGVTYGLIERVGAAEWRARWRSADASC